MKHKVKYCLGFLFIFIIGMTTCFSQHVETKEKSANTQFRGRRETGFFSSFTQKSYDVLHYNLSASLGMVDSSFRGTMAITVLITDPTDSLWFHSLGLIFDSLTVNDTAKTFTFYPQSEIFSIHLTRTFAPMETVNVRIDYVRDVTFSRLVERQGYYWYRKGYQPTVLENIGYTMSEPSDARLWMPCFDDPTDKATCEISVTVPTGYLAASNGLLTGVVNLDSTTIFHWRENSPVASYLMCITASKYSTFSHFYHKVTNPDDSLEVKYYIWQSDSAGVQFNAVQAFSKVTEMMRVYSTIFGEYPFEKYGMAAVYPFFYGGMEHQTMTTIHRAWVSAAAYPGYEDGIVHELAHQWWGDMVTCETFKDIWLNEGFASYAEALWHENEYGPLSYDQKMKNFLFFDQTWQHAIYDPVGQGQPLFGSSVYQKAAWVLHMLRYVVGDSMFFTSLHNYRSAHLYSTATTSQFNAVVNTTTGSNYDWFFNEWIYGPGWPTYSYHTMWDSLSSQYDLHIIQWPPQSPFKMPIEVKVSYQGKDSTYILWDSLGYQMFPLQANIDSFQFDPRNRILKKVQQWPTSVSKDHDIPNKFELFQNYPNPFNPTTIFNYQLPVSNHVTLKVYDMLGQEISTLVNGVKPPGLYEVKWDASSVPSGVYFYRLQSQSKTITRKMILMR